MTIELITRLILLYNYQDGLHLLNIVLLTFIWLSTLIFQVPTHLKLMQEESEELITKVIRTNWVRTLSWTVRALLLSYFLWTYLQF
ncbi:hypothetical protein [Winogradskyella sp. PG-2]|uniref:hypothetical protein n=1 Tax=Winogradskyella sp. PG-2 TaxID=754409 RepID=UPI0005EFCD0D|nr:hypothetical protein [Winogradskyella sp. PG-2]